MFAEMLRLEGERRWGSLLLLALLTVGVPVAYAVLLGDLGATNVPAFARQRVPAVGVGGAAALLGCIAAWMWGMGAWEREHRGAWVYALSLPVSRLRLFALRYAAALAWLLAVLAVASLAAVVAVRMIALPPGLYAYPGPWALWTALVAWLLFSTGFMAGAWSGRSGRVAALLCFLLWVALMVAPPQIRLTLMGLFEHPLSPLRLAAAYQPLVGY